MSIEVQWRNTGWGMRATVLCHERKSEVQVSRDPGVIDRELRPAEINWSAMGNRSVALAKEYGQAILKAVEVAREMEGPVFCFRVSLELLREDGSWKQHRIERLGNSREQVVASLSDVMAIARNVSIEQIGEFGKQEVA